MLKVAIIIGSTRPNRKGEAVARWVYEHAKARTDAEFELVDLRDYELPLLDEPESPGKGNYVHPHTKRWAAKVSSFDAFIFVTPEYNRSAPGALKNAIDFVYKEWNNKAAGFVSYGTVGGARAVEHLRGVMAEVQIADVRAHVALPFATEFENFTAFKPRDKQAANLEVLFDQVIAWGGAMKTLRR